MELLQKFERGMGLTLKNAWLHAEAVQVRFASVWLALLSYRFRAHSPHDSYISPLLRQPTFRS